MLCRVFEWDMVAFIIIMVLPGHGEPTVASNSRVMKAATLNNDSNEEKLSGERSEENAQAGRSVPEAALRGIAVSVSGVLELAGLLRGGQWVLFETAHWAMMKMYGGWRCSEETGA